MLVSNSQNALQNMEKATDLMVAVTNGGRTETRTLGPLIKSQLLYQLSYAPHENDLYYNLSFQKLQHFFSIHIVFRIAPLHLYAPLHSIHHAILSSHRHKGSHLLYRS